MNSEAVIEPDRPSALSRWMSSEAVLAELGIARSSMDRWRADGRGPRFTKLPNGVLRIRREKLDEWLEGLSA
ncbi:MAG TPA: helix-turn-helix domain-containing protein [Acidimicrobiales bacterium]|nr:helix-turn-helix domain-containing protein [Acidimicrobiales bacterium]